MPSISLGHREQLLLLIMTRMTIYKYVLESSYNQSTYLGSQDGINIFALSTA